jgi:hypothetical protein
MFGSCCNRALKTTYGFLPSIDTLHAATPYYTRYITFIHAAVTLSLARHSATRLASRGPKTMRPFIAVLGSYELDFRSKSGQILLGLFGVIFFLATCYIFYPAYASFEVGLICSDVVLVEEASDSASKILAWH